jgi:benzoyl-CoA reductase/2-hydroxyglutaryl-CoA dehydratase subunit BcrC/BadD/HgdB
MNIKSLDELKDFYEKNFYLNVNNKNSVFYFCSYVPIEIIHASNFIPVRLITNSTQFVHSDEVVPKYICPYLKSTIEFFIKNEFREKNIIFTDGCDSSRRIYEIYKEMNLINKGFYIKIPFNEKEVDINFLKREFENLFIYLSQKIDNDKLINSIKLFNDGRRKLLNLINKSKDRYSGLTKHYLNLLFQTMDIKDFLNLEVDFEKKEDINKKGGFYLFSTNFPLDFVEYVESLGYEIFYDDSCFGEKNLSLVEYDEKDPIYSLSKYYLQREGCVRRREIENKMNNLIKRFKEYNLKGVIIYNLKYCDPLIFFIPLIKEKLKENDIPLLIIDDDYSLNIKGQIRTRIEAFMEMLR